MKKGSDEPGAEKYANVPMNEIANVLISDNRHTGTVNKSYENVSSGNTPTMDGDQQENYDEVVTKPSVALKSPASKSVCI